MAAALAYRGIPTSTDIPETRRPLPIDGWPLSPGGRAAPAAAHAVVNVPERDSELEKSDSMALPTIFEVCIPRDDVLTGGIAESDFAADLAKVLRGEAPDAYARPRDFFRNTYPTRGLKDLLSNVCRRLSGAGGEVASIFRLDTQYGGGKTHGLIALVHAVRGMEGVENVAEFIDPSLLPRGEVRVAAFDGENADPANGRTMGDGIRAYTPWGEIAYALAGPAGYERVRRSDEERIAPGADTIRELFGGRPTLILLDELAVYLRKVGKTPRAGEQLTAFLTALFKAVESTPNAAVVYTLAVGKDGKASDAYADENQKIAEWLAEAESVSARKATLLNPTDDDEAVHVLRRRLFASVDEKQAERVIQAYRELWQAHREQLAMEAVAPETLEAFRVSYPFHPEVLGTLTIKTATLSNFQRVRGMLRILARTVAQMWRNRPLDAHAIHLHHIDLANETLRQEFLTRLQLGQFAPVIRGDIGVRDPHHKALAEELDAEHYKGLVPYATYVARTIFMHSLAFNEQLKGVSYERLRYSILGPATDISFIEDARKRFEAESAFLDDRPGVPLRFLTEANLTQVIRRQEQHVDPGEVRAELNDRIRAIFSGDVFNLVPFPAGAYDVPDDGGNGKPYLAVIGYDAVTVGPTVDDVPELIRRIFEHAGANEASVRLNRNNVVFVVADELRREEMRRLMVRRLALRELRRPERLKELAEHQQARVKEWESKSEQEVTAAIQQCYRHVFYPARGHFDRVDLAHTAVELPRAAATPGSGQSQVVRALRDNKKLRTSDDQPDSPAYIRDRTPLRKGQITTLALREEFRRDPALPILVGDDVFIRAIRNGVEQGEYVYRRGELLYGPGDPAAAIHIDEQAIVFTMEYAREHGIWPRPKVEKPAPEPGPQGPGPEPHVGGDGGEGRPVVVGPRPESSDGIVAEGPLRQALTQIWEDARKRKIQRLAALRFRVFDAADAFRLLAALSTLPRSQKRVTIEAEYETAGGGELSLSFSGPVDEAFPVKDFLDPQVRASKGHTVNLDAEVSFDEGLALAGDEAEKLTEKICRLVSGAAHVTATALQEVPA